MRSLRNRADVNEPELRLHSKNYRRCAVAYVVYDCGAKVVCCVTLVQALSAVCKSRRLCDCGAKVVCSCVQGQTSAESDHNLMQQLWCARKARSGFLTP